MKIEVGEYVRTKNGIIAKLEDNDDGAYAFDNIMEHYDYMGPREILDETELEYRILKHSFEPIDLIKLGDYVNGEKINTFRDYSGRKCVAVENSEGQLEACFFKEDIKTIVTKEMMEKMEYKVGE